MIICISTSLLFSIATTVPPYMLHSSDNQLNRPKRPAQILPPNSKCLPPYEMQMTTLLETGLCYYTSGCVANPTHLWHQTHEQCLWLPSSKLCGVKWWSLLSFPCFNDAKLCIICLIHCFNVTLFALHAKAVQFIFLHKDIRVIISLCSCGWIWICFRLLLYSLCILHHFFGSVVFLKVHDPGINY